MIVTAAWRVDNLEGTVAFFGALARVDMRGLQLILLLLLSLIIELV